MFDKCWNTFQVEFVAKLQAVRPGQTLSNPLLFLDLRDTREAKLQSRDTRPTQSRQIDQSQPRHATDPDVWSRHAETIQSQQLTLVNRDTRWTMLNLRDMRRPVKSNL